MGNKKLLVTGGAGFIGTNFIHLALKLRPDWDIVNLDALTYAGNPAGLRDLPAELAKRHQLVHGDIRDAALLEHLFKKHAFNGVIHFAAESHVDRSILGPDAFLETNIVGTFRLLEAGRKSWEARGKNEDFRFLHVSTDEVYGSLGAQGFFTELTPYDPSSPYSASKAASDHYARAYFRTYGLPTLITNCSNNFGPYQFPEKLIPLMILNIVDQKPLPIYGDGKNIRDWIYVVDHCKALITVLEKGHPGETYNVGGGSERENIEIVELLCDLVDSNLGRSARESGRRLIRFVEDRPGHDRRYAINFTKIRETLGWRPESTLEEGLKATVAWYLTRMDWVNSVRSGEYLKWIDMNYGRRAPAFKERPEQED